MSLVRTILAKSSEHLTTYLIQIRRPILDIKRCSINNKYTPIHSEPRTSTTTVIIVYYTFSGFIAECILYYYYNLYCNRMYRTQCTLYIDR